MATPRTISPQGQRPVAKRPIAEPKAAPPITSRIVEGGTPKSRRSRDLRLDRHRPGLGRAAPPAPPSPRTPASDREPHSGQKRAFAGSLAPQLEHLACRHGLAPSFDSARSSRARSASATRCRSGPIELAVVLVGDPSRSGGRTRAPSARPGRGRASRPARARAARAARARRARRSSDRARGERAAPRRARRRRRAAPPTTNASAVMPVRARAARGTGPRGAAARPRSARAPRASPRRKTKPASQIRFTSGFTNTLKTTVPSGLMLIRDHEEILARQAVAADRRPRSRSGLRPGSCSCPAREVPSELPPRLTSRSARNSVAFGPSRLTSRSIRERDSRRPPSSGRGSASAL